MNTTALAVRYPAAWLQVPLQRIDWISDPDLLDNPPRRDRPLEGAYEIGRAVNAAVSAAQSDLTDVFCQERFVTIDQRLTQKHRYVVEEWLRGGPELSARQHLVSDGRHRLWATKCSGLVSVATMDIILADAIRAFHDEDRNAWPLDESTLTSWREERIWWESVEAEPWRRVNPHYLKLFNEAIDALKQHLSE